jgi:hypothetical protein
MKHFVIFTALLFCSFIMNAQDVTFKEYTPCTFSIELPDGMNLSTMNEDSSPDYCDYEVKLKDGYVIMELHSMLNTRFEYNSIEELYNAALGSSKLNITYKVLTAHYFIVSGLDNKSGNIIYWKRVMGENFISDMWINYDQKRKADIEQYIGKIAKSFTSD